jgi:hypothetical protein
MTTGKTFGRITPDELYLAFPAKLAGHFMPGLFPDL